MTVLRDVLAKFAVDVDISPLTEMDRKINKLKSQISSFATIAGSSFVAAAAAAYQFVDAASDAEEQLNVVSETFGKGSTKSIIRWSKDMGKAMSRSEYDFQESAGRFGAFLEPVFRGTGVDIQKMSKDLSLLGVDLASFYNTSDAESLMRLFSGISGETEAVRRLGINISDEALTALHKSKGGTKNVNSLSLQEKTLLRIEKITEDTKLKQGDAIRTQEAFANQTRSLAGAWKSFRVEVGKHLLGPAKGMTKWLKEILELFRRITLETSTWETTFYAATLAGVGFLTKWVLGAKSAAAWTAIFSKEIGGVLLKTGALAAAFVSVEDAISFLRGGNSLFREAFTALWDLNRPVDVFNRTWESIAINIHNASKRIEELMRLYSAFSPEVQLKAKTNPTAENIEAARMTFQPKDLITESRSQVNDRNRKKDTEAAAMAGDKPTFERAMAGQGMSSAEIDKAWGDIRYWAIAKGATPNAADVNAGFFQGKPAIEDSEYKYGGKTLPTSFMSGGQATAPAGGSPGSSQASGLPPVIVNVEKAGADAQEIKEAVIQGVAEAHDAHNRATMARLMSGG